jgi:hypothetical protein
VSNRRERWLHTRISGDLEEALKREARRRRSPVSLVVRNVLESALDLVEDIVEDSLDVARRSQRLARRAGGGKRDDRTAYSSNDIYGWQEMVLNRVADCARCTRSLPPGDPAYRGLRDLPGGPTLFLCAACVRRLRSRDEGRNDELDDVGEDRQ